MTFALIPAGGKSTRMGRPKLALPLAGRTVLEHVIAALRGAGVEQVLVVVGPHVSDLVPLAEAAGAETSLMAAETPDMRATVEHGLKWIEEHWQPQTGAHWLLVPGDHPTLEAGIVQQLLQVAERQPAYSIFIPTFEGRRGHPALIAWKHVAGIRALPPDVGINAYFRQRARETLEIPVASATILLDLDLPEDYERLRQQWSGPRLIG
jgi:molybdenum cofactor cytidylyltransferase